jgi:hypothetical protein
MSWARRPLRVFGIEIDTCTRCGGKLRIIAGKPACSELQRQGH